MASMYTWSGSAALRLSSSPPMLIKSSTNGLGVFLSLNTAKQNVKNTNQKLKINRKRVNCSVMFSFFSTRDRDIPSAEFNFVRIPRMQHSMYNRERRVIRRRILIEHSPVCTTEKKKSDGLLNVFHSFTMRIVFFFLFCG